MIAEPPKMGNVLSVLDDMCAGDWPTEAAPADCQVIGHDCAAWIVVSADGHVWAQHPTSTVYVNESVERFETARRLFEARWANVDKRRLADDAVATALGDELREMVFEADPTLRDRSFSWWLGVIDSVLL